MDPTFCQCVGLPPSGEEHRCPRAGVSQNQEQPSWNSDGGIIGVEVFVFNFLQVGDPVSIRVGSVRIGQSDSQLDVIAQSVTIGIQLQKILCVGYRQTSEY